MMYMMGYDIDLFRKSLDDQILGNHPEQRMTEAVRPVCAKAVEPDCSMGAHDYHGIYHQHDC